MIKPVNISPLYTTNHTYIKCDSCGYETTITWKNRTINVDSDFDMEDLQKELCPECQLPLADREAVLEILGKKVELGSHAIEHLLKQAHNNKGLLEEYGNVFLKYSGNKDIEELRKLKQIYNRPALEGSNADFTMITEILINRRPVNLGEIVAEIGDLLSLL